MGPMPGSEILCHPSTSVSRVSSDFTRASYSGNDGATLLMEMPMLVPLLLLASAAQVPVPSPPPTTTTTRHWNRMFISPMGEPFRPDGRGSDALADWFG